MLQDVAYMPIRCNTFWRRCGPDRRNPGPSPRRWSVWRAELRAERNAPDLALLDEADPPIRRAVAEMGDVDVIAGRRNGAERQGPQRPKSGQHRPVEQQLLARAPRHLRRHVVVVRRAAAKRVDIFAQRLLAPWHGASTLRRRPHGLLARIGPDGEVPHALSRHHDL